MTGLGWTLDFQRENQSIFSKVLLLQRPGFMGMNDYAREEKMQKIFDDRENIEEEEEDEVKQDNKREKDKTVMNNHNDNNNSNHHEEKVSHHVMNMRWDGLCKSLDGSLLYFLKCFTK